jgi:hypothetical protein
MKKITRFCFLIFMVTAIISMSPANPSLQDNDTLTGSWRFKMGEEEMVICFVDDYFVLSGFSLTKKEFGFTWGGPYSITNKNIVVQVQFNTAVKELVGTSASMAFRIEGKSMVMSVNNKDHRFERIDDGKNSLAGVWRISGRKQGDQITEMPLGARRTLKILTGKRFQWAAINIETKEFFGTGGGWYSFENGKYTEHIEFFSRDNSRVGASLVFDGKLENGQWHQSGLSSKGEPIYEVWKRINK